MEDYVPYPIALALKKAGFDLKVNHVYDKNGKLWEEGMSENADCDYTAYFNYNKSGYTEVSASAPTLVLAQKWLREVKRIEVNASWENIKCYWFFYTNLMDVSNIVNLEDISDPVYSTYEQALSAGIAAALELIEKKGE